MGNYHSFGDLKFIPDLSPAIFETILRSNPLTKDKKNIYNELIDVLYKQIKTEIFNIDKPYTQLNFPEEGGVTGYFSRNMTKNDLNLVQEFL